MLTLVYSQVQGYFDIPVDNISAEPAFRKWIKEAKLTEAIFVTPHPQVKSKSSPFFGCGLLIRFSHICQFINCYSFSIFGQILTRHMRLPISQGTKRVANLSETLGMNFAIVHSTYDTETKTGGMTLVGDVQVILH